MSVLPQPAFEVQPIAPPAPPLPRTSVVLMLLLAFVTFGFYVPVWYLRRLKAFNALRSTVKVSATLPVTALALHVARFCAAFSQGVMGALGARSLAGLLALGDSERRTASDGVSSLDRRSPDTPC